MSKAKIFKAAATEGMCRSIVLVIVAYLLKITATIQPVLLKLQCLQPFLIFLRRPATTALVQFSGLGPSAAKFPPFGVVPFFGVVSYFWT